MKNVLALISFLIVSSSAFAIDMMAVEGGFKWNSVTLTGADSTKQTIAFQLGVSGVLPLNGPLALRSGMFYSERPFSAEFASVAFEGKFTYFDVPVQLMYRFEDYAGIYIGPSLAINLSNEVSKPAGYKNTDVKSIVVPITIGAAFKFAPQMGVNVFFESVMGDLAKDTGSSKAIGANFMFTLD